jgi:hypothetical protein
MATFRTNNLAASAPADVLDQVDATRLQRHLEWFSHIRRDTGGAGESLAADYIRDQLVAVGVPVTVHEFDAFLSYPRAARLEVFGNGGVELPCVTHSFAASTPPEGLNGRLVNVDAERVAHARDAIAVVQGVATPVTILQAARAGCLAVVFVNEGTAVHNMIGTTTWGTPNLAQIDRLPGIPVVSVGRHAGEVLDRAARSPSLERCARVVTSVETGWYRSRLPEVRIEGRLEPQRFALVGGHYCAWEVGVTDNATGDACLIEMARLLWKHRDQLQRSVRVCWWPGHSHGRYSGSTWYADTFFTDLSENCLAYQNIDSPGVRGATTYVARHTCAELEAYCRDVIEEVTGQANAPIHRPARAADQSFLANGVSSFSAYPFLPEGHPDRRPWTGGSANAWWWHTSADTIDKADADILARDTRLGVVAMFRLCNSAVLPLDFRAAAQEILDTTVNVQQRAGSEFDLSPVMDAAQRLADALDRLSSVRDAAADDGNLASAYNTLVLRLGRTLNPIIYSQSGRFQHDPAEWSPLMRSTSRYTMASLQQAGALPGLAGQFEYGFLKAQVTRERNRVVTGLADALALIDRSGLLRPLSGAHSLT